MGPRRAFLDRLVARYLVASPLVVEWLLPAPTRGFRRKQTLVRASVRDISVMGALIAVELPELPEIGDVVEIRRHAQPGTVRVRHCRNHETRGSWNNLRLIGVEFDDVSKVFPDISQIVGSLRAGGRRLDQLWEQAN